MDEDELKSNKNESVQFSLRGLGIFSGGSNSPEKLSNIKNTTSFKADLESEYLLKSIIDQYTLERLAYFQNWDSIFLSWVESLHSKNSVGELIKYIVEVLEKLTRKLEQEYQYNVEGYGDIIIEKILSNMLCKHLISSRANDSENSGKFIVNTNFIYELILHLNDSCLMTYTETIKCIQKIINFSQLEVSCYDITGFKIDNVSGDSKSRECLIDGLIVQLCKLVQHHNSVIRTEIVGILIYAILAVPMSSRYPYNPTRIVQALVWSIFDEEEDVVFRSIDGLRVYLSVVGKDYFNTVINLAVDTIPIERKQSSIYDPLKLLHQRILENTQLPDIVDGVISFADFNFPSTENLIEVEMKQEVTYNNRNDQTSENIQSGVNKILKSKSKNKTNSNYQEKEIKEKVQTEVESVNTGENNIDDFPGNNQMSNEYLEFITKNAVDFLLNSELVTEDWVRVVEEITNLRRVIIYHSLFLNKVLPCRTSYSKNAINTTQVGESIVRWVCSLRSCVCKCALQGIEDLYVHCSSSLDLGKLIDISLEKILKRTTDRNKFITNDATKTLLTICTLKAGDKLLGKLINHGLKSRSTVIIQNILKATAVVLEKIGINILKCSHFFPCLEFIHSNIGGPTPEIRTYSKLCIKIILGNVDWKSINQALKKSVAPFKLSNFQKDFEDVIRLDDLKKRLPSSK
ncbi:hypothetical protein FG386_001441 [Cryptosporidium ryanae]|uniref:uncharacterized protein n=1 Tax=Cryptosporidium ryanae TaxID=515981 RepID=UPI003519F61D|nr:hypothetical protein FG386_001441 [Cryptosporidium ryanae]